MQKEMISVRQAIYLIIVFIFGSSVVMGVNSKAAQDSWISLLLAMVIVIPIVILYARIMKLHPEKDIFDIAELLFGKIASKIFILLLTWYALHLGALVLRNFSEFIQSVTMPETPQIPIMILMLLITVYLAKSGIETLGKWSLTILVIVIFTVIITIFLSLKHMDFTNILPVMDHSLGTIAEGSFQIFSFPFSETVLFLCVACSIKKGDSPYRIYLWSILAGTLILLLIVLRNIEVLGSAMVEAEYFPSYVTARITDVGDFLTRVEGSISMNFILAGITKITLCILAASKGMARLFNIQDHRKTLLPVGLISLALCPILFSSTMEMVDFIRIYSFYALPFQIIIPLIIWITSEIKNRKQKSILKRNV